MFILATNVIASCPLVITRKKQHMALLNTPKVQDTDQGEVDACDTEEGGGVQPKKDVEVTKFLKNVTLVNVEINEFDFS